MEAHQAVVRSDGEETDLDNQLTFVTVAFEAEIPLLLLQARSMATFLPPSLVAELVVIDNTERGMREHDRRRLLREFGQHSGRVRVLRANQIADVPASSGWMRQQVLKLAVSKLIATHHYVVLDAKNHLVAPPTNDFFRSPDGRARVAIYSFVDHPLRRHLERVLTYCDLGPEHVARFTSAATPFVFDTQLVKDMMTDIEGRAGRPFGVEFVECELTEFFLYSAWNVACGRTFDEVFAPNHIYCPVVWPSKATTEGVESATEQATRDNSPFFSVHRRTLATLNRSGATKLAEFWSDVGLFRTSAAGRRFIRSFRLTLLRAHASARLRRAQPTDRRAVPSSPPS